MNGEEKPRGRQSEATAQHTRQRIMRSAQALFAARGFEGVSLRDIAEHSGVTHGLIRHHFGSKENIWQAVVDGTFHEYLAVATSIVEAQVAGASTALQTVKEVSRTAIVLSGRYPEVMRLLLHAGVERGARLDYFMEQLAPLRALMDPLIGAVQRDGGLRQFSHETFLLSLVMWGAMPFAMAAFSSELCDVDMLAEEQIERHADRVIATLFCDVSSQ
ncbi:MAG TPA: TetR/AcrR family transcriptional regulator [Roseiflexaceae bacterium]|nr:TetR/AcrR family transcriptional regulator [Roseiflexaceae bacterium]